MSPPRLGALAALLIPFLLGGCLSLPEQEEPPALYRLNAPSPVGQASGEASAGELAVVAVEVPRMAPGLGTDRIALIQDERRIDYFAGARWVRPLPELLQDYFVEGLGKDLPGIQGARAGEVHRADYRLRVAVRDFQAVYAGGVDKAPRVRVTLEGSLEGPAGGETRLRRTRERKASSNRLEEVVGTLEELLADAYGALLRSLAEELETGAAKAGSVGTSPEGEPDAVPTEGQSSQLAR
ncbi:MAG: ABC-type transport auxiliary lipoprotein family protein [Thiohalorhabdus sp.]|uniref:ABC-type transport auxiliary lipoprotein family protein n=1 Tax=Thiohalorhabdus sp. TaxID=3094134 RepID=UPI0039818F03